MNEQAQIKLYVIWYPQFISLIMEKCFIKSFLRKRCSRNFLCLEPFLSIRITEYFRLKLYRWALMLIENHWIHYEHYDLMPKKRFFNLIFFLFCCIPYNKSLLTYRKKYFFLGPRSQINNDTEKSMKTSHFTNNFKWYSTLYKYHQVI